nr:hypothetical protein [Tanacetum cinerariifolium]
MLAIPDEHLLKFHACKDAKSLWKAIKNSTNETVNTAHSVFAASYKDQASTASYADDVMFSFFSIQSNAPQLDNKDLEYIDTDDLEEMDLKWQMAMLTMRVKGFIKKTGRKQDLNGKETLALIRQRFKATTAIGEVILLEDTGHQRIRGIEIKMLQQGMHPQINESDLNDIHVNESEVLNCEFDSRKSDEDDNQVNDRFKKSEGYHAGPPPYTGNYMPPRADLSFAGLDDSVFKSK